MIKKSFCYMCSILFCLNSFGQSKSTDIPYDNIIKNLKKMVPNNWTLSIDSKNVIHVKLLDSIQICNFINSDDYSQENYNAYIKDKIIGKIQYELEINIGDKIDEAMIDSLTRRNDSISSAIFYLPGKYNIENLSHKFDDYTYNTETEKQNVLKYQQEKKQLLSWYRELPAFNTLKYSVYIFDNLEWYASICSREIEAEVQAVKKKTKDYLATIE